MSVSICFKRVQLAANADIYVNDAFGTAHRAHASTEGVTKFLKPSVAGFLLQKVRRKYVPCIVCSDAWCATASMLFALDGVAGVSWTILAACCLVLSPLSCFSLAMHLSLIFKRTRLVITLRTVGAGLPRWRRVQPQAPLRCHRWRLQGVLQDHRDRGPAEQGGCAHHWVSGGVCTTLKHNVTL